MKQPLRPPTHSQVAMRLTQPHGQENSVNFFRGLELLLRWLRQAGLLPIRLEYCLNAYTPSSNFFTRQIIAKCLGVC